MARPNEKDFAPYFSRYISKADGMSLREAMANHSAALLSFYTGLQEAKAGYAYAPGKWTIKEVLQHVIDAERIFAYRILRIARKDKTPLPSFDENSYAENSLANNRSFDSLKEEFAAVRKSTDLLIASLSDEQLAEEGISSGFPVTANAFGFILFGHLLHHQQVIVERYL
jgi:uncharacterized damage-inducible protein DinB